MNKKDRTQLFDNWAEHYDPAASVAKVDFPFAGYEQILDEVVRLADARPGMRVLDLGIGTGNLAARFLRRDCLVWGMDFSSRMLARARERFPHIDLVRANLLDELPLRLELPFDRVVSAYVLHEFNLQAKLNLLQRIAAQCLSPAGCCLTADIAFQSVASREAASRRWARYWDEDEYYWAADETIAACGEAGLRVVYRQLSSCGGVFVFRIKGRD